jgi:MiaB/RimO family radical SAM methylthiotransferase
VKKRVRSDTFTAKAGEGFQNISKRYIGGVSFGQLLREVSSAVPECRIRFVSPHPKDFGPEDIQLISETNNICKQLHMPVQSGSTNVLATMRRGYTREAYLELVKSIKAKIPTVCFSSDFIAGFCGETEADHQDTISLMKEVDYDNCFMFKYSQRAKTHAHRKLKDDVDEATKSRRLDEIIQTFRQGIIARMASEVGSIQLVLVEGKSRKNSDVELAGRTDGNKRVNFLNKIVAEYATPPASIADISQGGSTNNIVSSNESSEKRYAQAGDFVAVLITSAGSNSFRGQLLGITTLQKFYKIHPHYSNPRVQL